MMSFHQKLVRLGSDLHTPFIQVIGILACQLLKMFTVIQRQRQDAAPLKLTLLQQQQIQLRHAPGPTAYIQHSCYHQL